MMTSVDWIPIVSTVGGAAIAISGTVMADLLRSRDNRHRDGYSKRRRAYVEIVLALGAGLEGLRHAARLEAPDDERVAASDKALSKAGVYVAREKILMTAAPKVAQAAEVAFDALIDVRDAVRRGARLRTPEFHAPYHPYAEKMWSLRTAIREDLGRPRLRTRDMQRSTEANCTVCHPPAAVTTVPAQLAPPA